jgi:diaminopimelate decarboxylase
MNDARRERVTISGKYCESGDVLLRDVDLPPLQPGDVLAMPAAGAYALAMASNYNASLRPAVVLAANGEAKLMRRRETYEDLLRAEVWPLE